MGHDPACLDIQLYRSVSQSYDLLSLVVEGVGVLHHRCKGVPETYTSCFPVDRGARGLSRIFLSNFCHYMRSEMPG